MSNTFSFTTVVRKFLVQVICLAVAAAIGVALRLYIGVVVGSCMSPNIRTGDICLLHRPGEIQRGDVIYFWYDGEARGDRSISGREPFAKRVIGLPGDKIMILDGNTVAINGYLLDESAYIQEGHWDWDHPYRDWSAPGYDYLIPEGCYIVMGDNRGNSYDSRYWPDPLVYQEDIIGVQWLHIPMPIPDFVRDMAEQPFFWTGVPCPLAALCCAAVLTGWFYLCTRIAVFVLRLLVRRPEPAEAASEFSAEGV